MRIANRWPGCAHPVRLHRSGHHARRIVPCGDQRNRPQYFRLTIHAGAAGDLGYESCRSLECRRKGWLYARDDRTQGRATRVDRPRRDPPADAALRHGPDRTAPRGTGNQPRSGAHEFATALDHRHLRLPGCRLAAHHGHPRRSHRPPQAHADRRNRCSAWPRSSPLLPPVPRCSSPPVPCSALPAPPSRPRRSPCCATCSTTRRNSPSPSGSGSRGFSAGSAIGPLVGGVLLERFWWGSVFLISVPVMVVLLITGAVASPGVPRSRRWPPRSLQRGVIADLPCSR